MVKANTKSSLSSACGLVSQYQKYACGKINILHLSGPFKFTPIFFAPAAKNLSIQ
jgi:hypothetical protein